MRASQEVDEEVRGRLGDGQLDLGQHKGVPEMSVDDREEWRLQPHDMPKVQARVLLDVHGCLV